MNAILAIPLAVRVGVLFVVGLTGGAAINWCAYALAWRPRPISPWSPPAAGQAGRKLRDRVPVLGWWFLSRESGQFGRGHWIRPLVIELGMGLALAALYVWEVHYLSLYSFVRGGVPPADHLLADRWQWVVHLQFAAHALLLAVMTAASLIDLDEQTIPDSLTIPGTLAGLALAAVFPWSLLPADLWLVQGRPAVEFLTLASPAPWPASLAAPQAWPVAIGLGCWSLWCGGVMPRRWNTRHGMALAARVFWRRLWAERLTHLMLVVWLLGAVAIVLLGWLAPAAHWAGLLTALVGLAAGGGLIWIVRTIGTAALGREAMGFGDVMLLSMIGTFVGWQGALVVFFLAPLLGLLTGLVQWLVHGRHEIPYGPYLCLATLLLIVKWSAIWDWGYHLFALGGMLAAVVATCFVLMGLMLAVYGWLRNRFARG